MGIIVETVSIKIIANTLVGELLNGPWFLFALFIFYILVAINKHFFHDSILFNIIILMICLITPDTQRIALYKCTFLFLF